MEIFDMDVRMFDLDNNDAETMTDARKKMDDEVVKCIMEAIKKDDNSIVNVLSTKIYDLNIENSTSPLVFDNSLQFILASITNHEEEVMSFLCSRIWDFTKIPVEESVVDDILQNTTYSGKQISRGTRVKNIQISRGTRLKDIPIHDLEDLVKNVMTACNLNSPWYKLWHFSRDVTRAYRPFNPTSYPGYFQAKDMKDMMAVALNICNMQPAASVCALYDGTSRYEINFLPLSDLLEHKFIIKASKRNDKFIIYDGSTIKLRALTLYDIQLLKYLIKYFDCNASQSIYQLLSSMILSERDITLAQDIGWFSGISLDTFADSRRETYLLPDAICESDAYSAIKRVTQDNNNILKGLARDFKYQSATSPANIWIACISLVFTLVSVIQFFMGL